MSEVIYRIYDNGCEDYMGSETYTFIGDAKQHVINVFCGNEILRKEHYERLTIHQIEVSYKVTDLG